MRARVLIVVTTMMISLSAMSPTTVAQPSPQSSSGGSGGDTLSVGQIMARAVARAKSQDDLEARLWYESLIVSTVESLDGDGQVTDTETTLHKRYPLEGAVYEELVERDGQPLNADDQQEEGKRREEFRSDARAAAANGDTVETDDERQMQFDEELMSRYRAELIGEERLLGEPSWVIDFEPRDGRLPENTRLDKALNRSTGRLYVSQRDHGIMRIEFELQEPVRYLWGLVASLTRATGRLDFARVEPDVWLPKKFDLRIDVRIFFRTTRRHVVREWVERTLLTRKTAHALPRS